MSENVDKQLENFVDKAMKLPPLVSPSFDFTANVMSQVNALQESKVTSYQPLISTSMWIVIFTGFVAFVAYIVLVTKPEASGWFDSVDLNTERVSEFFGGLQTPRIAAYGVGLLALMFLVQIPLLKNYFDKRLSI